jgi:broad specificity phosphatase PhoE
MPQDPYAEFGGAAASTNPYAEFQGAPAQPKGVAGQLADFGSSLIGQAKSLIPGTAESQQAGENIGYALQHPVDTVKNYLAKNGAITQNAIDRFKQGDLAGGVAHSIGALARVVPGLTGLDDAITQSEQGNVGSAAGAATGMGLGLVAAAKAPEIAKVPEKVGQFVQRQGQLRALGKEKAADWAAQGKATKLITQALNPASGDPNWTQDIQSAMPRVKAEEVARGRAISDVPGAGPISGLAPGLTNAQEIYQFGDAIEANSDAEERLWNEFDRKLLKPAIASKRPASAAGVVDAVNKSFTPYMHDSDPAGVTAAQARAQRLYMMDSGQKDPVTGAPIMVPKQMTADQWQGNLRAVNAALKAEYAKPEGITAANAQMFPKTVALLAEKHALQEGYYNLLGQTAGIDPAVPREMMREYGALITNREALAANVNGVTAFEPGGIRAAAPFLARAATQAKLGEFRGAASNLATGGTRFLAPTKGAGTLLREAYKNVNTKPKVWDIPEPTSPSAGPGAPPVSGPGYPMPPRMTPGLPSPPGAMTAPQGGPAPTWSMSAPPSLEAGASPSDMPTPPPGLLSSGSPRPSGPLNTFKQEGGRFKVMSPGGAELGSYHNYADAQQAVHNSSFANGQLRIKDSHMEGVKSVSVNPQLALPPPPGTPPFAKGGIVMPHMAQMPHIAAGSASSSIVRPKHIAEAKRQGAKQRLNASFQGLAEKNEARYGAPAGALSDLQQAQYNAQAKTIDDQYAADMTAPDPVVPAAQGGDFGSQMPQTYHVGDAVGRFTRTPMNIGDALHNPETAGIYDPEAKPPIFIARGKEDAQGATPQLGQVSAHEQVHALLNPTNSALPMRWDAIQTLLNPLHSDAARGSTPVQNAWQKADRAGYAHEETPAYMFADPQKLPGVSPDVVKAYRENYLNTISDPQKRQTLQRIMEAADAAPNTPQPGQAAPTFAQGGAVTPGPTQAVVGEAGPERIDHSDGRPPDIVSGAQRVTLGQSGADQVTPLTEFPAKGIIRGSANIPLSDKGRHEAQALGHVIAANGGIDQLHASDLARTQETAQLIGQHTGAQVTPPNPGLRSWALGGLEGMPVSGETDKIIQDHIHARPDEPLPGVGPASTQPGESFNQFRDRILNAMKPILQQWLANQQQRIGVVTHGRDLALMNGWISAGARDDHEIDKRILSKSTEKPGAMMRVGLGPDGKLAIADHDPSQGMPGGVYLQRHTATDWSAKQGTSPGS